MNTIIGLVVIGAIIVIFGILYTKWEAEQIRLSDERRKAAGWRDDLSWAQNMALLDMRQEKLFREACRETAAAQRIEVKS